MTSQENWVMLNYAWMGHDLVYIPGHLDNEELSFEFFNKLILKKRCFNVNQIQHIYHCIMATQHKHLVTFDLYQMIADVDLFGFVTNADRSQDIFSEFKVNHPDLTWKEFSEKRQFFLQNLLEGRNGIIFQSKEFVGFNEVAVANIQKQIEALSS